GLGAGIDEDHAVGRGRRDRGERFREQAGQIGEAELRQARGLELEELRERRTHGRVVAADVVEAEAAEPVQVLRPAAVEEVRPFGPQPLTVEAEDAEDLDEARVRVALVEREALAGSVVEELSEAELAHQAKRSAPPGLPLPGGPAATRRILSVSLHRHNRVWETLPAMKILLATGVVGLVLAGAAAAATAPTVATAPATSVAVATATLQGTVNPNGQTTTWWFEYGTSTGYGLKTATHNAGSGTRAVDVSASLSKLAAATTYHFRLVASSAAGTSYGGDQSLVTLGSPGLQTNQPQSVTPTS